MAERIAAIDDFVAAGLRGPPQLQPGHLLRGWLDDYAELFREVDDVLSRAARRQLAAEVIFLTHNDRLHEVNLAWHPRGESALGAPPPGSEGLGDRRANVRYRRGLKGGPRRRLTALLRERLPDCRIRYAF
jgi:hypothetical protein